MTTRRHATPETPRTPAARLDESPLRSVIGYQLAQAGVLTDRVFDAAVGEPLALRRLEFTVLALLHGNPGALARQLSRALAVTPAHIAVTLERLEGRALIERERGTTDGRTQHLSLTASGTAMVDRALKALQRGEAAALGANLSPAEQAMLAELLHKAAAGR